MSQQIQRQLPSGCLIGRILVFVESIVAIIMAIALWRQTWVLALAVIALAIAAFLFAMRGRYLSLLCILTGVLIILPFPMFPIAWVAGGILIFVGIGGFRAGA